MTELWSIGASAAEAPSEARDRLGRKLEQWLREGNDGVLLATCHRVELYGLGRRPALETPQVRTGVDAVSHVLRVAAGLESAIVGEDEVLHQVRDALRRAERRRTFDFRLRRLFETAIATGRRARSRRTESSGNLALRAVAWLRSKSSLSGRLVIVAGAGRMGAALAHSLRGAGAAVTIASRDPARAHRLAREYGASGTDLDGAARLVPKAAAVAVALGGVWTELGMVGGSALPPIADISAPQSVPDSVRRLLDGCFLGIDDLYRSSEAIPGAYMKDAEALVRRYAADYMAWLESRA